MTSHSKSSSKQSESQSEGTLLVGLRLPREPEEQFEARQEELRRLADTAGLAVTGVITQHLRGRNAATLIGRGKVEEIAELIEIGGVDVVIFSRDLAPVQQRNLEKACGCRVLDRTELILDIFSQHAVTRDGKIQVELAQLRYLKPRLTGRGVLLSRLGGGIGTSGIQPLVADDRGPNLPRVWGWGHSGRAQGKPAGIIWKAMASTYANCADQLIGNKPHALT